MEEKFEAAVDVIRSIPYDGTFEPSNEMLLRLYALEQQASVGPCNIPKPYVWNISARAKWNAWNELGNMSKYLAMQGYIEELSKVVETMSYNDKIAKFMSLVGPFYEIVSPEDANSQKIKERSSDKSSPADVLDSYQPPTILEIYHMSKDKDDKLLQIPENLMFEKTTSSLSSSSPSSSSDISNFEKNWSLQSGQSQLSQSFHYSGKVPTYSESSSSSTDVSNFDVLSDLSDVDMRYESTPKVFKTRRKIYKNYSLTKKDLLLLTLMNVQTTMEDILKKIDYLNVLAGSTNFEVTSPKIPKDDWNMNITGTAFTLIWPILVQLYFDYLRG